MSLPVFISYNYTLKKSFTFTIIPDTIVLETVAVVDTFYIRIKYDSISSENITLDELKRYGSEFVNIREIYPYETQSDKDYYHSVVPNKISKDGDHNKLEMKRYNLIIQEIASTGCSNLTFEYIISFMLSQLTFLHLTDSDRVIIFDMGENILTTVPTGMSSNIYDFITMLKIVFDVYTGNYFDYVYKLRNNNFLSEFAQTEFPVIINAVTFKTNVTYIVVNIPVEYSFVDVATPLQETIQYEYTYTEINGDYMVDNFIDNISVTNITTDIVITLKEISVIGRKTYTISDKLGNAESYNISIIPSGSDTILNGSQFTITDDYACINICSDGTSNWYIK